MKAEDNRTNLCDTCLNRENFPECLPPANEVEYGIATGMDNIIKCDNYDE